MPFRAQRCNWPLGELRLLTKRSSYARMYAKSDSLASPACIAPILCIRRTQNTDSLNLVRWANLLYHTNRDVCMACLQTFITYMS